MEPLLWISLLAFCVSSLEVPYPVSEDTVFPGSGGCYMNYNMAMLMSPGLWSGCHSGGDYQSRCIPTADGGHRCVCSPDYQLYSDGVCKMKDPCAGISNILFDKYMCESSGGICKIDFTTKSGATCDCSTTGKYTDLYYTPQCRADPCGSQWGPMNTCRLSNAVCTPHHADAANLLPYSCQCPSPSIPVMSEFWRGGCANPCNSTEYPMIPGCEICTANATNPHGFSCKCNSPSRIYVYEPGFCYDPCKDPAPPSIGYNSFSLFARINGTDIFPGSLACRLYDPNASCYTTEKSPLFYQCQCSPGFKNAYFFKSGNSTYYNDPYLSIIDNIVTCVEGDPCDIPNPCGIDDNAAVCKSSNGSYTCQCSNGFMLSGNKCVRLPSNPCDAASPCGIEDKSAICTNGNGTYTCQCSTGFVLSGNKCVRPPSSACQKADKLDGNPCNNNGDKNATCTATCSTTYSCKCSKGFWAKDNTCIDSNECESLANPCPDLGCGRQQHTICRNKIGSHSCTCGNGAKCSCGTPAICTTRGDGLKKCKCGADVYYYY